MRLTSCANPAVALYRRSRLATDITSYKRLLLNRSYELENGIAAFVKTVFVRIEAQPTELLLNSNHFERRPGEVLR